MDITTFMIAVYCLIDDFLCGRRLRKRGPQPTLQDSEVLTIEVVGEFWGSIQRVTSSLTFAGIMRTGFPGYARSLAQPSPDKLPICGR
jgi:hypothetical protein